MGRPLLPQQRGYLAPRPSDELLSIRPASAAAAAASIARSTPTRNLENARSNRSGLRNNSSVEAPKWDNGALDVHLGAISRSPMKAGAASLRPITPASASGAAAPAASATNFSAASGSRPGTFTASSRLGTSSGATAYNSSNKMSAEAQLREDIRHRPGTSSSTLMAASSSAAAAEDSSATNNGNSNINSGASTYNGSAANRLVTSPLKLKDVLAPRDTHNRVFDPTAPASEVQARATVAAIAYSEARNGAEVI